MSKHLLAAVAAIVLMFGVASAQTYPPRSAAPSRHDGNARHSASSGPWVPV